MEVAKFLVRYADVHDVKPLLELMRLLAEFEGYDQAFCVTEKDLIARGFQSEKPQFRAVVAQSNTGELIGYAVVYQVDFTYDLRPNLHLKELFVQRHARQFGVGKALMEAVINDAKKHLCGRIKWDVLPSNDAAKIFYQQFQAQAVTDWESWILKL